MLNKVTLIGRVGREPEVRRMPDGSPVASLSVATGEKWVNDKGEHQERTEWHNIVAYGKLADIIGKWLKKGSLVYFEGKIRSRKYSDRNGTERTAYEIIADQMKMLGGKETGRQPAARADDAPDDDVPF